MASGDAITFEAISEDGEYPVFGGNGVRGFTNKYTHEGTHVLVGRQGALCGNVNLATGRFWASEHAVVCSSRMQIETGWLARTLTAMNLRQYSVAAAQPGLAVDALLNLRVPVPTINEQTAIAAFLDRETAKIDALVAEQERLIELLKEKRQAVISHAVTKGLNPNAPMKDSGIEWLGQIPAHWTIKNLKHISPAITVGVVVNPSSFVSEDGLPFIYGGDIREGSIDHAAARRITAADSNRNVKTKLSTGDLLTVRVGAPGVTAVVPPECDGGNCASVMHIRRGAFCSDWLCFVMNTRVVRFQVEVVQYGAAQEQFNIAHALNFWIPTPPHDEQEQLARYIGDETHRLDELLTAGSEAISILAERRSALISAAVTGQIDVRE